jgi:hypothetical protein
VNLLEDNQTSRSWLDRVLDRIKPQPSAPESPAPPAVDQTQWERSVDSHEVNTLTIHDVGLIVFNEMQAYGNSDSANESLALAREKIAHALINADNQFGLKRGQLAPSASPIEPSGKALQDPRTKAAYESSLTAARSAYLSLNDPTHGATNFWFRTTSDRSNMKFQHGTPEGLPLKTQSGPFANSYLKGDVPSRQVWVNTYGP